MFEVSVPSRGLSYLNDYEIIAGDYYLVSVPSRGLSYLNNNATEVGFVLSEFPSPHGDSLI